MQQETPRPRLQLRPRAQDAAEARLTLVSRAIRDKVSLRARYNGQTMLLAPRILFARGDAAHVDAAVLERDGRRDEELRLRTFNLAGLHGLETSGRHFALPAAFDEQRYQPGEVRILAIVTDGSPEPEPAPLQCSAERPWGVHPRLDEGSCPRCGWQP